MRKALLILLIVVASCAKDRSSELIFLLTDDNCKYWDVVSIPGFYDRTNSITFPLYCYSFDKNENWLFFNYKKGIRQPYVQHDIVIPRKWSLIGDTSILLGYKAYKIEKLTKDTLIYTSEKLDTIILIKSLIE